jgi:hypothetical protein
MVISFVISSNVITPLSYNFCFNDSSLSNLDVKFSISSKLYDSFLNFDVLVNPSTDVISNTLLLLLSFTVKYYAIYPPIFLLYYE